MKIITVDMVRTAEKARLEPVTYAQVADSLNQQITPVVQELVDAAKEVVLLLDTYGLLRTEFENVNKVVSSKNRLKNKLAKFKEVSNA